MTTAKVFSFTPTSPESEPQSGNNTSDAFIDYLAARISSYPNFLYEGLRSDGILDLGVSAVLEIQKSALPHLQSDFRLLLTDFRFQIQEMLDGNRDSASIYDMYIGLTTAAQISITKKRDGTFNLSIKYYSVRVDPDDKLVKESQRVKTKI